MARGPSTGITVPSLTLLLALVAAGCTSTASQVAADAAEEGIDDRWMVLGAGMLILASFLALLHRRNTVTQGRHALRERISTDLTWLLDDTRTPVDPQQVADLASDLRSRSARAVEHLEQLAAGASGELANAATDLAVRVTELATIMLARIEGAGDPMRNESRLAELSERVRVAQDRLHNALRS